MLGEYDEVMKCTEMVEEDSGNLEGSCRRLKMIADMFAIKGNNFCSLNALISLTSFISF